MCTRCLNKVRITQKGKQLKCKFSLFDLKQSCTAFLIAIGYYSGYVQQELSMIDSF